MQEMTILLKGLTCANCAGKIEHAINRMRETKEAEINLVKQEMQLSLREDVNPEQMLEKVKQTVARYESGIEVSLKTSAVETVEGTRTAGGCHEPHVHESGAAEACGCHKGHEHIHEHTHTHEHAHGASGNRNRLIARFGIGIALFLAANIGEGMLSVGLFLAAYLVFGYDVLYQAICNMIKGQVFDENFLMALATVGAIAIGEMPEAVFVMLFYQVGEAFQDYAVERSRKSITSLMDIRPDYANVVETDGSIHRVSPEQVKKGTVIQVKAGEKIPLDGVVLSGWAMLDTAALTGESVPRRVDTGNTVLSGCINTDGLLQLEVTKPFAESTVMKILELVEHAAGKKSKTEKFITRFARVYTPVVVGLAVLLACLPPLLGYGAWAEWIGRALVFLVVSCPCALVLSVPLSYFAGIGAASKNGILVKGGNYLDILCQTDRMVFDKTGTLTKGAFSVTQIEAADPKAVLQMAAAGEQMSNHPIARAITAAYEKQTGHQPEEVTEYQEKGGYGITYLYQGKQMASGNARLMEALGVSHPIYEGCGSVVYVAADGVFQGYVVVDDTIKEGCAEALEALRHYGIQEIVMLSGDRVKTAEAIGQTLGMDRVYAELLPQDKLKKMEEILQTEGKGKTAFVGDGINDAPVLAGADVGIAMGAIGSDAAIEAADVVLMDDDISKIAVGMRIAKNTRTIVLQNITFALGVKVLVLLLSAVGLATMWMAVFADVGVAVLAILNAMRKK